MNTAAIVEYKRTRETFAAQKVGRLKQVSTRSAAALSTAPTSSTLSLLSPATAQRSHGAVSVRSHDSSASIFFSTGCTCVNGGRKSHVSRGGTRTVTHCAGNSVLFWYLHLGIQGELPQQRACGPVRWHRVFAPSLGYRLCPTCRVRGTSGGHRQRFAPLSCAVKHPGHTDHIQATEYVRPGVAHPNKPPEASMQSSHVAVGTA